MMIKKILAAGVLGAVAGAASAGGGDYGLVIVDNRVVTGVGDHDDQVITNLGERVFAADMGLVGTNWFADEPGIFIEAGSMPDGVNIGFVIEAAVRRWDGTGAVDFSQVASQAMTLEFGPQSATSVFTDGDVAGFGIAYDATNPTGFDEHWDILMDASAGTGIYLLQLRFTVDGFEDSLSTWTVFNAGLDEAQHEEAIAYVENVIVPAPGVGVVLGLGGLLGARRRR